MGTMRMLECASMEDRETGLRLHLETNYYPPHPQWVIDRIMSAFQKHWSGEWSEEQVIDDLLDGIMRNKDGVYRHFGAFFETPHEPNNGGHHEKL